MSFRNFFSSNSNDDIVTLMNNALQSRRNGQINQANNFFQKVVQEIKNNSTCLNRITTPSVFGQGLSIMLSSGAITNNDDIQKISELSYYFISKAIISNSFKGILLIDRLTILYNAEDYIKDVLKRVYDLKVDYLDRFSSPREISYTLRDYLEAV